MPKFQAEELEHFAVSVFEAAGVLSADALQVGRHLVEANLAGHDSHGILRIPQYVSAIRAGHVKLGVTPKVLHETPGTAVMSGGNGFGQVAAGAAASLAIRKARTQGVAAVSACKCYHSGRVASYALQAAAEGLAGIVLVNAGGGGQSVAPFGGLARRLATNPISIAAPTGNGHPVVLDIATSVAPEGKLRDSFQKGQPVPEGWLIDAGGKPTTEPKDFYSTPGGALLPFGGAVGYKGFGLAFMIDILAGALSGAGCCRTPSPDPNDGLLVIAIDVQQFLPLEEFYRQVAQLVAHVKSCPPAPGFKEVFVPGELEAREEARRRSEGILVDPDVWNQIESVAAELGVAPPDSISTPATRSLLAPRFETAMPTSLGK